MSKSETIHKTVVQYHDQRNREIGKMLAQARHMLNRTVTECAEHIGTTRHRYRSIEGGNSSVTLSEFEMLRRFLEIPDYDVYPIGFTRIPPAEIVRVHRSDPGKIIIMMEIDAKEVSQLAQEQAEEVKVE